MKKPNKHQLRKLYIILGWLAVWQLMSLWVSNSVLLVGPFATGAAMADNLATLTFWLTVGCSMLRIAAGFLAGVGVGLILAAAGARFVILEEILSPLLTLIKAVPVASFVVLFLIWWDSDILSVVISFCVVLPNIYINTLEGIRSTDERLLEMAKVFRFSGRDRFFYLYRPALKPFLDSSIRVSVGMSWKSGVAAEVIGTPAFSIGERLYMSKIYLDTANVLAWTAVTIILSVLFEKLVLWIWEKFCQWQPPCKGAAADSYGKNRNESKEKELLILRGVTKAYNGQQVMQGVTAQYKAFEIAYFRTPSGSGKTTLFRLIAGLEKPDEGVIERYGSVGMVFQENRLCEDYSAVRNVELITGNREEARKHLILLLDEKDIDKPCRELSGGMKRRVAIARAFASGNEILLLDEPYTGLDSETLKKVQTYISTCQGSRTLLIATHR